MFTLGAGIFSSLSSFFMHEGWDDTLHVKNGLGIGFDRLYLDQGVK
jgi:hypothetical protein